MCLHLPGFLSVTSYCSFTDIPHQYWANKMLAQRCKQSQSTRKRNGEAFPQGYTANYLIFQINCSFSSGWSGKYSTSSANKPVHTADSSRRAALFPPQTCACGSNRPARTVSSASPQSSFPFLLRLYTLLTFSEEIKTKQTTQKVSNK